MVRVSALDRVFWLQIWRSQSPVRLSGSFLPIGHRRRFLYWTGGGERKGKWYSQTSCVHFCPQLSPSSANIYSHVLEYFLSLWEGSVNSWPGALTDHRWLRTADYISSLKRTGLRRWSAYCLLTVCKILNFVFSRDLFSASLTLCLALANRLPCIGQSSLAVTSLVSLQVNLMPGPLILPGCRQLR